MSRYVDAHVHFWDVTENRYPWLEEARELPRRATLDDYRTATTDGPPEQFVFVQAGTVDADGIAEARWVSEMCAHQPDFGGLVAWGPAHHGEKAMAAHLDALGLDCIVAIRQLIQSEPPGFCTTSKFTGAVASLARYDLAFDICIFGCQLGDAALLAAAAPETRLVLDHLAKPSIADGEFDEWRKGFLALARHDNVWCKLSGLVTEADHANWTTDDLQPYVDVALETFGPTRMLWGSDWPVCTAASSHQWWRSATTALLAPLAESERQCILHTTVNSVYHLQPRTI